MRRLAVIALLVALGLSALWLASRRSVEPHAIGEVALRPESVDEQPEIELATPDAPAPVAHEPEAQRSAVQVAPVPHKSSRPAPSAAFSSSPIAGRVVRPDGAPVPNAEVELECAEPFRSKLGPLSRARTDSDGRFGLPSEHAGPFRVTATEREKQRVVAQVTRDDVYPRRGEIELVLQPALARGRVVDDLERPIPDFRITWTPLAPDGKATESWGNERFQSASGEFRSLLSPGTWRASVTAKGGYVAAQAELLVPDLAPATIVLARQGLVRGVVVDDLGKPVPRARLDAPEAGIIADTGKKDGSFELRVTPDTSFTLWAEHAKHAPSARVQLSLAPGEERADVVLQLGALAHLSGEVVDPHGLPVSGRKIHAYHQIIADVSSPNLPRSETSTDDAGRFEIDVVPGQVFVSLEVSDEELRALGRPAVQPGRSRPSYEHTLVIAAGESAFVRFAMGGSPVRLHGRIEVGGCAPESARIDVLGSPGWGSQYAIFGGGTYEVLLPEPGLYRFIVSVFGVSDGELNIQPFAEVPAVDEFRFDVSIPVGRVTGRVRDEAGRALEGVVVDARGYGKDSLMWPSARATTDREGAYALTVLPGTLSVDPRTEFEEQRAFRGVGAQIVRVEPDGEVRDVDFVLQATGALDGLVRRADGGPLIRAHVSAQDLRLHEECDDYADDDGRFHLPLDGGAHWLSATGTDGTSAYVLPESVRVVLAPGAARELELILVPAVSVRVQLVAKGDLDFTQLEALDERGRSCASDRQGEGRHGLLLVPGAYTLRARYQERLFERPLEVTGGAAELALDWPLE